MNKLTFRPKQSLGQNFLVDENIARKIIQMLTPNSEDVILEIGPGFGVLTKYLIPEVRQVVAIEIDRHLIQILNEKFGHCKNFELVAGDFLKVDLSEHFQGERKLRVVGNIPYHITSPVVFKVFEVRKNVFDMILMIQQEVADRIVAEPGNRDYGILSVFSQLYSKPKIQFHVSKNVFKPKPDVDSSVVRWDFSKERKLPIKNEELLNDVIRVAFNQRRKMLRRSLQQLPAFEKRINEIDFNLQERPEKLSVEEFVELSNLIAG